MTAGPCGSLARIKVIIHRQRNSAPRRSEAEPHWCPAPEVRCRYRRIQAIVRQGAARSSYQEYSGRAATPPAGVWAVEICGELAARDTREPDTQHSHAMRCFDSSQLPTPITALPCRGELSWEAVTFGHPVGCPASVSAD